MKLASCPYFFHNRYRMKAAALRLLMVIEMYKI